MRDGEASYHDLSGVVPYLERGGWVPYSIEMLEADRVPLDFNDPAATCCRAWNATSGAAR